MKQRKYSSIVEAIFRKYYRDGCQEFAFTRDDIQIAAQELGMSAPKNLGDVLYSFRYRAELPDFIQSVAPKGKNWIIVGEGSATYKFKLSNIANIIPNPNLELIPVPDATPEVISMYQLSDEQSLLCKIRYNRLMDIFLGIVTYSMQNHLRTQVSGIGQIEIDELYVGVNKKGQHFIMPVEAKVGNDKVGVVQVMQDVAYCKQNFRDLICLPVSVHEMKEENAICMFLLNVDDDGMKIIEEKHYQLQYSAEIDRTAVATRNQTL